MKTLEESEYNLMKENEKLRLELEQIKSLLNKNIACEQLSNIGSVKMLCDELAKSKRDVYCVRDEFKKLLKLVNEKDYYQAKQRLQTIIENWEKLYNNPQ